MIVAALAHPKVRAALPVVAVAGAASIGLTGYGLLSGAQWAVLAGFGAAGVSLAGISAGLAMLAVKHANRIGHLEAELRERGAWLEQVLGGLPEQAERAAESIAQLEVTAADLTASFESMRSDIDVRLAESSRAIDEQRRQVVADLVRVEEELRQRLGQVEHASQASSRQVEAKASEGIEEIERLIDRISGEVRSSDSNARREFDEVQKKLTMQESRLSRRINRERSERILGLVRREAKDDHLDGVLIVLCPPRTGSTWLFDALRCHPRIEMTPTSRINRRTAS